MDDTYTLQKSHAYCQFEIIRSKIVDSAGTQVSYNVPTEIVTELIKDGVLVLKETNEQGKDYYLNENVKFILSKNIIKLIGEEYENINNIFFVRWAKSNNKPQLIKAAYKNKGENYKWFVNLYDKNGIGNTLKFEFNEINKEFTLDVSFNYEKIILETEDMQTEIDNEGNGMKKEIANKAQTGGENRIYYGAPGCGKSHHIKEILASVEKNNIIRVTFHPEYSNCDFVGQILPTITKKDGEDKVSYDFRPGPFTLSLERALTTNNMVYLIIEEINRGNAAAIFGDLFQLLDRQKSDDQKPGESEYFISNPGIEGYLKKKINLPVEYKLVIPSNLSIFATMNSCDQNVFTLDTAFKRRWYFEQMPNTFDKHPYANWIVPGTQKTWKDFVEKINPAILDYKLTNNTNEDKQLGVYFVSKDCLIDPNDAKNSKLIPLKAKQFAYKVLEYIWNDVCKIDKDKWFDVNTYKTLEDLINGFVKPSNNQNPLAIFKNIQF